MTAEDKIRRALHRLKTKYHCEIPSTVEALLPSVIAEEFGGPDLFTYKGWTCTRIVIEQIPKEHRSSINERTAERYGYVCTKGGDEKFLPPESANDVTMEYTKTRIDFWEEWLVVQG